MAEKTESIDLDFRVPNFKFVLLGESAVGKTSIALRFVQNKFFHEIGSTVGAAYLVKTLELSNRQKVKLEIWDTAGQERYRSLAPMYYINSHAAIIVYDVTNRDSFEKSKGWMKELQRVCSGDLVIALCGNKKDLEEKRVVDFDTAYQYAHDNNLIFGETSAKTGRGIEDIFTEVSERLPIEERIREQEQKRDDRFKIGEKMAGEEEEEEEGEGGCGYC